VIHQVKDNLMAPFLKQRIVAVFQACRQPLFAVLDGITDQQLSWKPAPESRSIGEIFRHLIRVDGWFLKRLGIEPVIGDAKSGSVEDIRLHLESIHQQISEIVAAAESDEDFLRARTSVDGKDHEKIGVAVLHIAQHDLYHLAQVVYLRRAQDRTWPAPTKAWEQATYVMGDMLLGIDK